MAKEQGISVRGVIIEEMGNAFFKIQIESGHHVQARVSGPMVKHNIQVHRDDSVLVEVSPYDLERGRITWVYK